MEDDAAHQLDVEMALAERAPRRLAHRGEGLGRTSSRLSPWARRSRSLGVCAFRSSSESAARRGSSALTASTSGCRPSTGDVASTATIAGKGLQPLVDAVNAEEPRLAALSDDDLKAQTPKLRERLAQGESLEDVLPRPSPRCARRRGARSASAISTSS